MLYVVVVVVVVVVVLVSIIILEVCKKYCIYPAGVRIRLALLHLLIIVTIFELL